MMNGSEVVPRLEQTAHQLTREKQRLESEAAALDGHVNQLVQQRGAALLELARYYLPDLERSTVETTLAGIRQELFDVLARRDAQQRDRAALADRVNNQLLQLQSQLAAVTETLNGLVKRREALEPVVAAQLAQDPKFPELAKLADIARVALQRNQVRVTELQQTAKEKLPAYERSSLFQYLYRRQFATSQYASTGWARDLDRWVARLIDYPQARHGYEFLRRSPAVLTKELKRRQQEFDDLLAQMQTIDGEIAKAAGLTDVREQGADCGRQRDALVTAIQQRQDELHGIQIELQQLTSGQNKFYQEALTRLQRFLGDTNHSVLEARARQTPEQQDDQIVATIAALTTELDRSKPRINELNQNRGVMTERVHDIERVIGRCRQQNFDSARSYFEPPFEFESLLARVAAGDMTSDDLWRTMRAQQRFRPTETSQLGGIAADAMSNQALLNVALQITAAVIDVAAHVSASSSHHHSSHQSSSQGGSFGDAGSVHHSTADSSFGGNSTSFGGGDASFGASTPSSEGSSDSGGSFTSGDGF